MARAPRNYRREYDQYHGTPEQIKARDSRNAARREAVKDGKVHKGDGKEIDHKDGNPRNNSPGNLRVTSRTANRKKGG
jgi:hypothetical protein